MSDDHPDYHALLAAVLADPEDDMPRLVAADWLEENAEEVECPACKGEGVEYFTQNPGCDNEYDVPEKCRTCKGKRRVPNGYAERAEFIRVQCELATKSDCPDWCDHDPAKCRVEALRNRERHLLDQHWSAWIRGAGLVPDGWKLSTDGDSFHVWRDAPFNDGYRFQFRRGFVDSVTLPLRLWVGEPCPGCIEPGELDDGDPRCRLCHGLGTVGGIGPDLVRRCPLTRVTLSDRAPEDGPSGYSWFKVGFADGPATLPESLFDLLSGDCSPSMLGQRLTFETPQAALDALSDACLGWARATPTNTTESPREGATR